jgi:hypothetical protein
LQSNPVIGLLQVLSGPASLSEKTIAVTMRGKCDGKIGGKLIRDLSLLNTTQAPVDQDSALRRRFVRACATALARMNCHELLAEVITDAKKLDLHLDGMLANKRGFDRCLTNFITQNVTQQRVSLKDDQPWFAELQGGTSPKPTWLIRLVLDRIRFRVSGKFSTDREPKYRT